MDVNAELNVIVLEKVFGFPRKKVFKAYEDSSYYSFIPSGKPRRTHAIDARPVPFYAYTMDAAWQVVERMQILGWVVRVSQSQLNPTRWNCRFVPADSAAYEYEEADTAPLAICLAALKAIDS